MKMSCTMQKSCERGVNSHLFHSFLPFFDQPFAAKGVRKSALRNFLGDFRNQPRCGRGVSFPAIFILLWSCLLFWALYSSGRYMLGFLILLALSSYFLVTGVCFFFVAMAAISSSSTMVAARATFPGVAWCVEVSHSVTVIHTVWCMAA